MQPRHPLAPALIALLIAAAPVLASPAEAVAAALADARQLPADQRLQTQYLALYNLPAAEREDALKVLAFQVNSLSRRGIRTPPRVVNADLLAVQRIDYGWQSSTWEKFAALNVYFTQTAVAEETKEIGYYQGKTWVKTRDVKTGKRITVVQPGSWIDSRQWLDLVALTGSAAPVVRADWFLVRTSRQLDLNNRKDSGVGYYDFLGLKDRKDFDKLVRLDEKASIELDKITRAAMARSGVSTQNRQMERYQSLTGGYWRTLDNLENTEANNALRNPGRGEFKHNAERIYGVLPNELFAFFLSDDKGARQDSVPDFIGPDDSPLRNGHDSRIHPGIGCVRCHTDGLRPVEDFFRKNYRGPLKVQIADYAKAQEFKIDFLSNLDRQLEKDRTIYADALKDVNGLTPVQNARAVARMYDRYVLGDRGPDELAAEMGVTAKKLLDALDAQYKATGGNDLILGGLRANPPAPIRVEHVEELFPALMDLKRYMP